MEIKGITIESGKKPVICIPVMGATKNEIIEEAKRVIADGAKMIEWRIDYMTDYMDTMKIKSVLEVLAELCQETILLATIRTSKQGGMAKVNEAQLKGLYQNIAKMHLVDMLDVEFFELKHPEDLIEEVKDEGVVVITSHHDFESTPEKKVMMMIYEQMAEGGADIVKLATMPEHIKDVLAVLEVTSDFYTEYEEVPIVSMSMGSLGMISRLSGEIFGSCITFGTMGKSSAPGQIEEKKLAQVLNVIHENYKKA